MITDYVLRLITGASRGIGRATAIMAAQAGATVIVNYRSNQTEAEKVVHEITRAGGEALAIRADVAIIHVNCVAPGWVETGMSHAALIEEGEEITSLIPLRRAGTPEEIAGPILFLASNLANFITGEILNVNGGSVLAG